ncbi:PH domain-containing protein [Haliscomenobacter sp.]|uniref:PH domain-containing protein n=1 Tax=Haliscomenobacter sp. TaxID=2717303 RepID=UPI003BAA0148
MFAKTYPSKIGLELLLPILFILLSTSALMITSKSWLGLLIILAVLAFILHLFFNTHYTIEGHLLTVKSGFLYNSTIDIHTISKVSETNNLISSPAISLDRLEIRYGSHNSVIISPKEKQDFLDQLLQINPKISIHYKKR